MARRKRHEEHENHERWLVSYADFITLLFAFFVVMFASSNADKGKAEAVRLAIEGESDEQHPASLLQGHPRVTFVLDDAAAERLGR